MELKKKIHYIGESYGGGIVFYVDDSGQHGLIATTSDQSAGASWDDAVQICADYTGGSYDDWHLPSKEELELLYLQKNKVGLAMVESLYCAYWSSTIVDEDRACYEGQFNGLGSSISRKELLKVRAVRVLKP